MVAVMVRGLCDEAGMCRLLNLVALYDKQAGPAML